MLRLGYVTLLLAGFLVALVVYCDFLLESEISPPPQGYYQIKKGTSLNSVTRELGKLSIVPLPHGLLKTYAWLTRNRGTIKAGEYRLTETLNTKTLLQLFRDGNVIQRDITFPEGWTLTQWITHLRANEYLDHSISHNLAEDLQTLLENQRSPEGQFFPDTYLFPRGESDLSILERAHSRMQAVLNQQWQGRDAGSVLKSPYELLILASIVEKETGYGPDRPYVSSVFNNRLNRHMKLQSDPTVIYGLGEFDGNLTRKHLRAKTPFNTYVIRGLPPTPICNPGLASIHASLHPVVSDYLYFVARGDGTSEFTSTLGEHNSAVNRYQKATRVRGYKSAPDN